MPVQSLREARHCLVQHLAHVLCRHLADNVSMLVAMRAAAKYPFVASVGIDMIVALRTVYARKSNQVNIILVE